MARGMVVTLNGVASRFGLTKVDRDKLYGSKKRVAVDAQGRPCVAARLTGDGISLVPPGGLAYVYLDDAFNTVERGDLQAVGPDGQPVATQPSTLDVPMPLVGPVSADRVLDCTTNAVYELAPEELSDELKTALDGGAIFETQFAWREAYTYSTAFLLHSAEGYFALITEPHGLGFVDKAAPPPTPDAPEDDAESDDFDFSMM
jgi:hypothetical protein